MSKTWIVSQDKDRAEYAERIELVNAGGSFRILVNGRIYGRYSGEAQARRVMDIIFNCLSHGYTIFFLPWDDGSC